MSEQDINNESYEIPTNDMGSSTNDTPLVGGSSVADTINAAGGVDPSRFWVVFMIALILALAAAVVGWGANLLTQLENKDKEIKELRIELKECPQKTLDDFKKQSQAIDQLRLEALTERSNIEEIKREKIEDVRALEKINKKLENVTP